MGLTKIVKYYDPGMASGFVGATGVGFVRESEEGLMPHITPSV